MADITPKAFDGMTLALSATPLKGNQGEQGNPGNRGDPGKSNYQLWLEAGNAGTIEDFLATTKGEKGDDGKSLTNRGYWGVNTYYPGDFVISDSSETDTDQVLWFFSGSEAYISNVAPFADQDNWTKTDISVGIPDAPADGGTYGRKNNTWVKVSADEERELLVTLGDEVTPEDAYVAWCTDYGLSSTTSDWTIGTTDDGTFLLFAGARTKDSPAIAVSSEGQISYNYAGNPTSSSTAISPPNTSRAYWLQTPRPWKVINFHPNGLDARIEQVRGHVTEEGLILTGRISSLSNTALYVHFAIKFVGGSWELYLRTVGLPARFMLFNVSGGESSPAFTMEKPQTELPAGTYAKATYLPV